jgi:hypothetical protein
MMCRRFSERITWGLPGVEAHGVVGQDGLLREDLAQLHRVLGPARRRAAAAGPELDELAAPGGVAEGDELLARGDALLDLGGGDVDDVLARGDLAPGRARGEGGGGFHAEEVLRVVLHLHGAVGGVVAAGLGQACVSRCGTPSEGFVVRFLPGFVKVRICRDIDAL